MIRDNKTNVKETRKKNSELIIVGVLIAMLLGGCGGNDPIPEMESLSVETETPTAELEAFSVVTDDSIAETTSAEAESGAEFKWVYSVTLDENTEEGEKLSEIDRRIAEEIDAINLDSSSEVDTFLQNMRNMYDLIETIRWNNEDKAFRSYKRIEDDRGEYEFVYPVPEKPYRLYINGKLRCMYLYPVTYSNHGAYAYLSEDGRASVVSYDILLDSGNSYYLLDHTLLMRRKFDNDCRYKWQIPDWKFSYEEKWMDVGPVEEDVEHSYEFQSTVAEYWRRSIEMHLDAE